MGCGSSAAKADTANVKAGDGSHSTAQGDGTNGKTSPEPGSHDGHDGGDHQNGSAKEPGECHAPRDSQKDPGITASAIREILQMAKASEDQVRFFEAWTKMVFEAAAPLSPSQGQILTVATDLSYLELQVCGEAERMFGLAKKFASTCQVPDTMIQEMEEAQLAVKAADVTLWCKLRQINRGNPGIDAGFTLNSRVDWTTADILMPWVDDTDTLREYTTNERHTPKAYGSSMFPNEPERLLKFEMTGERNSKGMPDGRDKKKSSLLASFFFFKSLGFAKPEDDVVRWLNHCNPRRFTICVTMGPKGLTRLSMALNDPGEQVANELADCLDTAYSKEILAKMQELFGGREFDIIEYGANAQGYAVYVGYAA